MTHPSSSSPSHGAAPTGGPSHGTELPPLDMREHGAPKNGEPQTTDKRLFVQLLVFTGCFDPQSLVQPLASCGVDAAVYLDVNDPRGVAVLFLTENPSEFTGQVRKVLTHEPFRSLTPRPEMTMIGRTYSGGREADLEDWLLQKPKRNALNPKLPWVVWYPLRRKPEFELLTKEEQGKILFEHAKLGMSYGQMGLAHDIRLACYGLDQNDNEFVLGIVSPDLHPISRLVQDMRKTQQTSKYIQSLGPFFVGKVFWQSPMPPVKPA